jgi:hypothetical protein
MFKRPPLSAGFVVASPDERAPLDHELLPVLILTVSLLVSIAIVLTTVTTRATQLF